MELSIRTRSIEISDSLRDLIAKRLQCALDAFGERVKHASVYLADVNGPRGGIDKSCNITVAVHGIGEVLATGAGATFEAALTRAARRSKRSVSEALKHVQRPATESIRKMAAIPGTA